MKYFSLFVFICTIITCYCGEQSYTNKYDNIDLEEILANDRLLTGYVNCLLELGPCTSDGKELKKNLPDAIQNDCAKCTEKQRYGADKVMHHVIDNRPDDWTKLEEKYKSDGTYKSKYLESKKSNKNTKDKENHPKHDGADAEYGEDKLGKE